MIRVIIFINIIFCFLLTENAFADISDSETYSFTIKKYIEQHEPIGAVFENQHYGLPHEATVNDFIFGRMVAGSYTGDQWELTTNKPIGVSVSYNTSGSISATLTPITTNDGFVLPETRIYPTKIIFGRRGPGVSKKIFKFYPIVKVYQNSSPGVYFGTIEFTILEL